MADSHAIPGLRDWHRLDPEEQTRLLTEHGQYLDTLPPTCSMEIKTERLRRWLEARGISYQH
jgi:hypothetical protein